MGTGKTGTLVLYGTGLALLLFSFVQLAAYAERAVHITNVSELERQDVPLMSCGEEGSTAPATPLWCGEDGSDRCSPAAPADLAGTAYVCPGMASAASCGIEAPVGVVYVDVWAPPLRETEPPVPDSERVERPPRHA